MKLNQSKIMPCNQHWVSTRFHDMEQCKWKPIVSETLCQFLKPLTCINSNKKTCFSCNCIILGEQGWQSSESARLPPMCPRLDSQTQRHMWIECFVGSLLCSERVFSGYSGFPISSKTNISKFQFDPGVYRHFCTSSYKLLGAPRVNKLHLHFFFTL